ncbi:hypothetical protein OH76DRAFT_719289 [Lentinus brumalis]|uniref:Uncharacterized protein n=1 Tax=Lentinus brumalis TaxID=2498619 RepID=A0A371CGX6_9APHY|nr:hypothetical protein OH76DRAFT_719289 [Polyporus brumalis]
MLACHREVLARYAADDSIICSTFNEIVPEWPASVRSIVAFVDHSNSSSSSHNACGGNDMSTPMRLGVQGHVSSTSPVSCLVDCEDPNITRWLHMVPRYRWSHLIAGVVREVVRDATIYHDCRFARSRHMRSGATSLARPQEEQLLQAYGTAISLMMVPTNLNMAGSESQPEADLIHDRAMGDVVYSDFNGCLHNAGNADATDAEDDVVDTDATDEALDADDADDSAEGPATPGHAEDDFEVQFECFHPNNYDATEEGSGTDYLEFDRTTENTLPYRLYDSLPSEYAHLHLSASPFHPVPLVPIFCVADEHNIVPLLVSAIAQRAALGLELPVIGIMYPTVGSTFSVLVAWRDISTCAPGIRLLFPPEGDSPSHGVFDLERPASLSTFAEFLRLAAIDTVADLEQLTLPRSTPFLSKCGGWRVDHNPDHELEYSRRADIVMWYSHVYERLRLVINSASSYDWPEISGSEAIDRMSYTETDSWSPERELHEDEAVLIDLERPGIAAWSLDYHVLTVGLNRGAVVYAELATVFGGIYDRLFPQEITTTPYLTTPIIGGLIAVISYSNQDEAAQDVTPIWTALIAWSVESETSYDAPIRPEFTISVSVHTLRCTEYDRVARSLPDARMPHVGFDALASDHDFLASDDWQEFFDANENTRGSLPDSCRPAAEELESVWRHTEQVVCSIRTVTRASDTGTKRSALWTSISWSTRGLEQAGISSRKSRSSKTTPA